MKYLTDDKIQKLIPSIKTRAATLRKDIVRASVSIMHNWAESGAVNVAAKRAGELFDAVDDAHKVKVANWFGAFAGFTFDMTEDTVSVAYDKTKLSTKGFQSCLEKDIFAFTPDNLTAFKLDDLILNLVARAEKRLAAKDEKRSPDDDINTERLMALKALVTTEPVE